MIYYLFMIRDMIFPFGNTISNIPLETVHSSWLHISPSIVHVKIQINIRRKDDESRLKYFQEIRGQSSTKNNPSQDNPRHA